MEPVGSVASGYEPVREAFLANFETQGEVGAGVAVYVDGVAVVDLVGGIADASTGRAYDPKTLQLVFSTTKGLTAICTHQLVERGVLDLDTPIAEWWPEFAQEGKQRITLRWVLSHRAGLPVIDAPLTFDDLLHPERIDAALAAQRPLWEPNSRHGYHPLTYGWLLDAVFRRAAGRSVSEHFRTEIAEPLGLDCSIGVPPEQLHRAAPVIDMAKLRFSAKEVLPLLKPSALRPIVKVLKAMRDPESTVNRATYVNGALKPADGSLVWNHEELWTAAWPAATAVTDARSLARLYAACVGEVDGIRLLRADTVDRARAEMSYGPDATSVFPSRFGLGFHLHHELGRLLGPASFGHGGMGGSLAFADPDARVGFGYVMNQMKIDSKRSGALVDALRSCVG